MHSKEKVTKDEDQKYPLKKIRGIAVLLSLRKMKLVERELKDNAMTQQTQSQE